MELAGVCWGVGEGRDMGGMLLGKREEEEGGGGGGGGGGGQI